MKRSFNPVPRQSAALLLAIIIFASLPVAGQQARGFRPPAVPLVTHSPYFSVWSMSDSTTTDWTKHWTGAVNAMCGIVRGDGKSYRYMSPQLDTAPPLQQTGVEVTSTRTTYHMQGGGIALNLTFLSPLLPKNLDVLARPVTYVTWEVKAIDGQSHQVALYADFTGEWAVNTPNQIVDWKRSTEGDFTIGRCGTSAQQVLVGSSRSRRTI